MMYLWIAAALVSYFIKGLCGFADALIFNSILSFGINTADISPVLLVTGYPTSLIVAWQNRRELRLRVCLPLAALVLAGCIPGAFMLKNVDARLIKFIFGFVVVALGVEMLLRERRQEKLPASKPVLALIGVLAGVLCGLFGVGALMAAYVGRVTETNSEFKANMNAVFFVEGTFRLILYLCLGLITPASLRQSLILMPCMLAGIFLGSRCSRKLNEKVVKKLVIFTLILSGVLLILRNL